MKEVIQIDDKIVEKNNKTMKKTKIVIIFETILYLLISTLLMVFRNNKNHQLFMIISIIITVLYFWSLIFSIDIFIRNNKYENKWISYYIKFPTTFDETEIISTDKDIVSVDRKQYYKIKTKEEKIYLFLKDKYSDDVINQKIILYLKDNVIVGYSYERTN